jgi:hypothetical protein
MTKRQQNQKRLAELQGNVANKTATSLNKFETWLRREGKI